MNKKNLIILVSVLGVLIVGGIIYFALGKQNKFMVTVYDNVTNSHKEIEVSSKTTIKDIVPEEKEDYKFVSWTSSDGKVLDENETLDPNEKIYAVYEPLYIMYTFEAWNSFAQTHKVIISDNNILAVIEKAIPNDPNIVGGGTNFEYTVKGLKAGNATVTLEIINSDGSKESSETYYFNVDANLNVNFEKSVKNNTSSSSTTSTDSPSTTPSTNGTNYTFETTDKTMCNGTHKTTISDTKVLSLTEKEIPNNTNPNIVGGCFATNSTVTVKGLKKGSATVIIEYYDISNNKEKIETYYFNVDANLNVNFVKVVKNDVTPSTETPVDSPSTTESTDSSSTGAPVNGIAYVFETTDKTMCNGTHKTKISNTKILSLTEKEIPNNTNPNIEGGCFAKNSTVTVKGLKKGSTTVIIEYYDISSNKAKTETYYFNVDANLNVNFEKVVKN